ncbi:MULTISPECIES: NAD(P)-dependent oxidoreductase [Streptosporangium]|uniref:3-hydroxyisobutyrate dehydrogenase-like beta-hydroxyacid dehydrogenase n=1 Tax=Streptosporangium brasiliense TaxID=47480 RepID=A0ABT9RLE7_9ACTN|nr:NAD(P)-binding domain-containing protein [Streptosporangium brasiliense]MDP9869646.1 3-hydroxyisobutyrate dehydrogenase-like beta-hydroxyacid dehydrogenase [Streptosporangium brasiliense]
MDNKTPVTVVGLGLMGQALAAAFLAAGHPTTVWNRTAGKADDLVARGAVRAATVAEAVAASPLTVVCVVTYEAVDDVLDAAGGGLAGRVLVNLTNGTPGQARRTGARVAGLGADYVDGGIMAVPQMIAGPGALILYSGARAAFETHRQALEVLGEARYLDGDPGTAPLYDLALLTAMYGMFGGFYQSLAMVRAAGIKAEEFTPMVTAWLAAMAASMPAAAAEVDAGEYATKVSNLAMNQAAFPNFIDANRALGLSPDLLLPIKALIDRAVAEGHGGDGLARLVELI